MTLFRTLRGNNTVVSFRRGAQKHRRRADTPLPSPLTASTSDATDDRQARQQRQASYIKTPNEGHTPSGAAVAPVVSMSMPILSADTVNKLQRMAPPQRRGGRAHPPLPDDSSETYDGSSFSRRRRVSNTEGLHEGTKTSSWHQRMHLILVVGLTWPLAACVTFYLHEMLVDGALRDEDVDCTLHNLRRPKEVPNRTNLEHSSDCSGDGVGGSRVAVAEWTVDERIAWSVAVSGCCWAVVFGVAFSII